MFEEFLVLLKVEAATKQAEKSLFNKLHLTLYINRLETAQKITRLSLMIQVNHAYRLAHKPR